jgi:PKD repeat protein
MKRLNLLLFALLACFTMSQAQSVTVTFSGTVTETGTGNPIANHMVYIMFDSSSFNYFGTTQTNALGQYTHSVPGVMSFMGQGDAWVFVYDCNSNYVSSQTITWTWSNTTFNNVDFQICTTNSPVCSANFSSSAILGTTGYNFADLSASGGPAVSVNSWFWDFGDGNTSTSQNPQHFYAAPGAYRVCLTIGTSNSCNSTWCDSIGTGGGGGSNCMAGFSISSQGCSFTFLDSSSTTNTIATYAWDFGDGSTGTGANPTHVYGSSGSYVVCLTITDSLGCTDTQCRTVTCGSSSPCNSSYFWYPDSSGQYTIIIVNTASGSNLNYLWTFGDGSSSTLANPSHVYAGPGTYVVCLTVTDNNPTFTCTSTFCDSLTVLIRTANVPFSINVINGITAVNPGLNADLEMQVAPNPARDQVQVQFTSEFAVDARVEVLDLQGRVLRSSCHRSSKGRCQPNQYPAWRYATRHVSDPSGGRRSTPNQKALVG